MKKKALKVEIDLKFKLFDQSTTKFKKKNKIVGEILDFCVEVRPILKFNEIVKDLARLKEKKIGIEKSNGKIQGPFNSSINEESHSTMNSENKKKLKSEKVLNLMIKGCKEKTEPAYCMKKRFWSDVEYQLDRDFQIIHQNIVNLSNNQSISSFCPKFCEIESI